MACCALVLRLLAYAFDRMGLDAGRLGTQSIRRVPIVPLLLLMVPEVAVSLLLVRSPAWAGHAHSGHDGHDGHDGHMMTMPPEPMSHGMDALVLTGSVVAAVIVAVTTVFLARRGFARARIGAGIALATIIAGLAASPVIDGSHLVTMVVLEACLVICPLLLIGPRAADGPADDVWVVVRGFLALVAGVVVVALVYLVHAPTIAATLISATGAKWWVAALGLALGAAFWASLLRFRLPPVFRQTVLFVVLEAGAVLGLAMLLAPTPAFEVVTDQRMAGLFMMAVDIGVLIMFSRREAAWEWKSRAAASAA